MSRHGGGGYEELDYEANNPVSVWRPEFAGVLVPEGTKESLREAATEPRTAPTDPEEAERSDWCEHGVYIGRPGGRDYLCTLCETEGFEDEGASANDQPDLRPECLHTTDERLFPAECHDQITDPSQPDDLGEIGDYGRCLCGHLDDDHDDTCTVWDCECENFETDGTDLATETDHNHRPGNWPRGVLRCATCGEIMRTLSDEEKYR